MPALAHRFRGAIFVIALLAALAVAQATAAAALVVEKATLDGGPQEPGATSISTPPGGVLSAGVTTRIDGGTWSATRARIGTSTCVDHENNATANGLNKKTFNVTAPGTPGDYAAGFTAASTNSCGAPESNEFLLSEAVRVTTPGPNPNLEPVCGIDVMLVLDESGSIGDNAQNVRNAATAFLNALDGTGSKVAIVDFSTTAKLQRDYATVTQQSIKTYFTPYLENEYKPGGWTNWEAAFQVVKQSNARPGAPKADMVFFITDGDPTALNTPNGEDTGLVPGDATALRRAATEADLVKAKVGNVQGSHVMAMGVGAAVTDPTSARRLTAISGFQKYPNPESDIGKADYTLVEDFGDLADALKEFAVALCKSSVSVTKLVDEGDGTFRPDPDWRITATVLTKPGSYSWVIPPGSSAPGPRTVATDDAGVAAFQWKPSDPTATSQVSIEEESRPGYTHVDWTCVTNAPGRTKKVTRSGTGPRPVPGELGPNEYARCTLRNRILPGTIEIEKHAWPETGQTFSFTGSPSPPLENFSLTDDGEQGRSSRTFAKLVPGTYTVNELVPDDWELTGIDCGTDPVTIAGSQVTIPLAAGGSVVCTYSDRRIDPPSPPEPIDPGIPGTSGGGDVEPVAPPPSTQLRIEKVTRARARVGGRVPFTLRVTNIGPITADEVILTDIPPAAMEMTPFNVNLRGKKVRGNAVWKLGDLAPGASKIVRGVVRIDSATPGIKRNTAIATAVNANLVQDQTDTRVLPRLARVLPAVTG